MKILAFYLPQFHTIPENDEWWGKGFTEWTNTRKAKPLFNEHNQPREPLNDYYYNLLDSEARAWQAKLAKENGVYGFCYYHYWFNGKKLLEKPLEEVLRLKEPDFPFCLSWANEPWTRAWDGTEKEVIMPQSYGSEKEWFEHFQYLLNIFQDERYIKVKNKPVFVIYRPSSINNCSKMLDLWNQWAKEYGGFEGIHFIETLTSYDNKQVYNFAGAIEFEPMFTLYHEASLLSKFKHKFERVLGIQKPRIENYDKVWNKIIKRQTPVEGRVKTYKGAFVDWDNSARKGKNSLIIKGSTPEKFGNYLKVQADKINNEDDDFLFINAWNEWAEGTYLEPDKKNRYEYLKELKKVVETVK